MQSVRKTSFQRTQQCAEKKENGKWQVVDNASGSDDVMMRLCCGCWFHFNSLPLSDSLFTLQQHPFVHVFFCSWTNDDENFHNIQIFIYVEIALRKIADAKSHMTTMMTITKKGWMSSLYKISLSHKCAFCKMFYAWEWVKQSNWKKEILLSASAALILINWWVWFSFEKNSINKILLPPLSLSFLFFNA